MFPTIMTINIFEFPTILTININLQIQSPPYRVFLFLVAKAFNCVHPYFIQRQILIDSAEFRITLSAT
jgi:hypothetical protein